MTAGSHHTVCVTDEPEQVLAFLREVIGLDVVARLEADGDSTSAIFAWPAGNPGAVSTVLGTGGSGMIELVHMPDELRGKVEPGAVLIAFTVEDLEHRVSACRQRGIDVTDIVRVQSPTVNASIAVARAGGIAFELVRFEDR